MKSKIFLAAVAVAVVLTGCTGIRAPGERQARADLQKVGDVYRPSGHKPPLPALTADAGLSN